MAKKDNNITQLFGKNAFSEEVEELVWMKDITYMEAILEWCDTNKIEIEQIVGYIKRDLNLKALLQMEGEKANMIQKTARLDF